MAPASTSAAASIGQFGSRPIVRSKHLRVRLVDPPDDRSGREQQRHDPAGGARHRVERQHQHRRVHQRESGTRIEPGGLRDPHER
jgi:hypothetical protein